MSDAPRHSDGGEQATGGGAPGDRRATRRSVLRAAGAGAGTLALGSSSLVGSAAAEPQIPTPRLETDGNVLVDPEGNTVTLRGVNVIDPRRADTLAPTRGKDAVQQIDTLTDKSEGWYTQVVRVPLQPSDIAETTTGYAQGPLPPGEFSQSDLEEYCRDHVDDVVDFCEERGVYVILDYHRHWTGQSADSHETSFSGYWAREGTDNPTPDDVNEDLRQEVVDFWEIVAERYGQREHTLFEVYNEPTESGMWGSPLEGPDGSPESHWAIEWTAFVYFLQPAIDEIESHTDNVQLLGSPSWTQSPEGILIEEENLPSWAPDQGHEFRQFDEPANLAMTYHIYPGHNISLNVASGDVDGWDDATINGEGVAEVYEEYPLFVTEFGWDNTLISQHLQGDTPSFGDPFFEWMEESEAISYTAWCGDIWWDPTMFERAFEGTDSDISNPYAVDVPQDCPDLPCEWNLLGEDVGDPDDYMGAKVKNQLAEYRDHNNPSGDLPDPEPPTSPDDQWTNEVTDTTIEMEWESVSNATSYNVFLDGDEVDSTSSTTYTFDGLEPETTYTIGIQSENSEGTSDLEEVTVETDSGDGQGGPCEDLDTIEVDGETICNVDGDDYYRDVNGDGNVGNRDVGAFFDRFHLEAYDRDEFDYSGNGRVSHGDVVALFDSVI